jgi:hypothetical protein
MSIAKLTAANKKVTELMNPADLTAQVISQGGSVGSALQTPGVDATVPSGPPLTRSRVVVPSASKRHKPLGTPSLSKRMRVSRTVEINTTFVVIEVRSELEPGWQIDYEETKTMYEKF